MEIIEARNVLRQFADVSHEIGISTLSQVRIAIKVLLEYSPAGAGPTGRFPHGEINSEDGGELNIAIAADPRNGIIRVVFGARVSWVALPPMNARQLAESLLEVADIVEKSLP